MTKQKLITHSDRRLRGMAHYVRDQDERAKQTAHSTELAVATTGPETESLPGYQPRIYVVDVGSQEPGFQRGQWVDANQPVDELEAAIDAVLEVSPTSGESEWAVDATEGFGGLDLRGFTDTALISRLARGVAEHGAAYAVYVQIVGTADQDLLDKFDDFYVGSYDSPEAWARDVGEDLEWEQHLGQVVDPMLRPYVEINYAHFARDQRHAWDIVQGVDGRTHIFMR